MKSMPIQISSLVSMENPQRVVDEVKIITSMMSPEFDAAPVNRSFIDILRLFDGNYSGYRACDTQYHDLKHTTDTFLAMARIIHGATVMGYPFSEWNITLGLISALLHDTGYILAYSEEGPGARHTLTHIQRSIDFMDAYFVVMGLSAEDVDFCRNILRCTGIDVKIDTIPFASHENEILGKMLGTADLLGQMADRTYLEKLPFLYDEFIIAGVPGIGSELDFYRNTPNFFDMTVARFQDELGGVSHYMRSHFRVRWGIDEDLYMSAIERSMAYLEYILAAHPDDCRKYLRRSGVIQDLERIRGKS